MFRGKAELGANDVMVVKSEEYDTSEDHIMEDTDSDEEGLANRDLVRILRVFYCSRLSQKLGNMTLSLKQPHPRLVDESLRVFEQL